MSEPPRSAHMCSPPPPSLGPNLGSSTLTAASLALVFLLVVPGCPSTAPIGEDAETGADVSVDAADTAKDEAPADTPDAAEVPLDTADTDLSTDAADIPDTTDVDDTGDLDTTDAEVSDPDVNLDVPPDIVVPPGSTCLDAIPIIGSQLPFAYTGDSTNATNDYDLGGGCGTGGAIGEGAPDVVFSFTPDLTGWHVMGLSPQSLIGSNPSALYVTTDCAAIGDTCVAVSSDLTSGGFFSVFLEAGTEYFVIADGLLSEDAGQYMFTVDASVCTPSCPGAGECGRDNCGGFCGAGCDPETSACHPDEGVCKPPVEVPKDNCVGAPVVDTFPFTGTGDTFYGSNDYATDLASCPGENNPLGAGSRDHIYILQPTVSGVYTVTLTSEFDGVIYVATSCTLPESFCIGAADATTHSETLEVALEAGENYFVYVDGASNDLDQFGVYTIFVDAPCVPDCSGKECGSDGCIGSCGGCPAGNLCGDTGQCQSGPLGDHCLNAIPVTALPFTDSNDTTLFSSDFGYSAGACPGVEYGWGAASADVVYRFVAPEADTYTFSVTAGFDTTLYAFTDCTDVDGSCLAASEVNGSGETLDLTLSKNQSFYVVVDGYGNLSDPAGPYTFTVDYACTPNCDGKDCGGDGCGGICGECSPAEQCNPAGVCEDPLGNSCANPFPLGDAPLSVSGDTSDASPVLGYPYDACGELDIHARGVVSRDEVYQFTPTVTGVYDIEVDADFAASWYLITDCTYYGLECFLLQEPGPAQWFQLTNACKVDEDAYACEGTSTKFSTPSKPSAPVMLQAGTAYFIVVDGASNVNDENGTYTLSIGDVCIPQCDGKQCGADGCGLTCGECELGYVCGGTQQCETQEGNACWSPFVVPGDAEFPWTNTTSTSTATNVYGLPKNACEDQEDRVGAGSNDHVYAFTAPADGTYEFTVDANFLSAVYVLNTCDAVYESGCYYTEALGYSTWTATVQGCFFPPQESVCAGIDYHEELVGVHVAKADLTEGETYYVVVDGVTGLGNSFGPYTLTVDEACSPICEDKECGDDGCGDTCGDCPGGFECTTDGQCVDLTLTQGNSCVDPFVIPAAGLPYLGSGDTTNDSDVYEPCSGTDSDTRDEVWTFTPDVTQVYVITVNASFDASFALAIDCDGTEFTCVSSTEDETISQVLDAGTEYFIIVDGGAPGQEGDYILEVKLP